MPDITTFLTFNDQAEAAAGFYTSVFPRSEILRVSRYPDLAEFASKVGTVMTVEFTLEGRAFTALNAGPRFTFSQGISIAVQCESQAEIDEYWGAFAAAGGTPIACGWMTDHFGVSWQFYPKLLTELIHDPDRAARAMRAMMTMVKIDCATIERAVEG